MKEKLLKLNWIKWIQEDEFIVACAYKHLSPILEHEIWKCNLQLRDIKVLFQESFWRNVLECWSELNYTKETGYEMILKQPLWFNSNLRINDCPFLFVKPFKDGLTHVCQLFDHKGKLFSAQLLTTFYDITIMQANKLLSVIPSKWRKIIQGQLRYIDTDECLYNEIVNIEKIAPTTYAMFNFDQSWMEILVLKWYVMLRNCIDAEELSQMFANIYKVTNFPKLRSFQYRLLVFNKQLKLWKITTDDSCINCKQSTETENVWHFFIECPVALTVWQKNIKIS